MASEDSKIEINNSGVTMTEEVHGEIQGKFFMFSEDEMPDPDSGEFYHACMPSSK